ncbi:MAG: hypothetical protein OEM49_01865 [Myxococcales bacterium]|nr:hypothetical protein [Myxococcales bacterium]MDH5306007.1 hypothetical protein [Myxococcales bacterium]MDH5566014.1 hypothetical protein [Myxococcales bacterium]
MRPRPTRAPHRRAAVFLLVAALFIALAGSAGSAAAQNGRNGSNGGNGANGHIQLFGLTRFDGYVGLDVVDERDVRTRPDNGVSSKYKRLELSEILFGNASGFAYHPRFLTFQSDMKLRLRQDFFGDSNNVLVGGNLRVNVLPEHAYGASAVANVIQTEVPRRFAPSYEINSAGFGGIFYARQGAFPFSLSYHHRRRKGGINNEIDEIAENVQFNGRYSASDRARGSLGYDLLFREDLIRPSLRRQTFTFQNRSDFDAERSKRLNANLRLLEQFDRSQLYIANGGLDFDWRHTEDLSTRYLVDFRWDKQELQTVTNVNPRISLQHHLYESLASRLDFYSQLQDATFGDRAIYGGRIDEDYIKRVGNWGRLGARIGSFAELAKNRPQQPIASVSDESHSVDPSFEFELSNANVDPASVVVTDDAGVVVYVEGLDYRLREQGSATVVEILLTGSIALGQVLLVDYQFDPGSRNDILTTGFDVRADFDVFDTFSIYGRYNSIDRELLEGDPVEQFVSPYDRRRLIGGKFARPWIKALAEFEDFDSRNGPYEAFRGSVSLYSPDIRSWNGSVTGAYNLQDFTDVDRTVSRMTLGGRATRRVSQRGVVELQGDYRRERWSGALDQGANDIDALRVEGLYTWWYGQIRFKCEAHYWRVLQRAQDQNHYLIALRMRREF